MSDTNIQNQDRIKELLLEDYKHAQDSFWKNESLGETRVKFFITLVTAVTAGLVALVSEFLGKEGFNISDLPSSLVLVVLFALAVLMVIGISTFSRLLKRNEVTDEYKSLMDKVRQRYRDLFDPEGHLNGYRPFAKWPDHKAKNKNHTDRKVKKSKKATRKIGGLVLLIIIFNSVIASGFVGIFIWGVAGHPEIADTDIKLFNAILLVTASFIAAWAIQRQIALNKNKKGNSTIRQSKLTHSGGVVYSGGKYLVTTAKDNDTLVLPKGHIKNHEGHKEAAIREVKEETGIIGLPICPLTIIHFVHNNEKIRCKYYLMQKIGELPSEEGRKNKWLTYKEAKENLQFIEQLEVLEMAKHRVEQLKLTN